MSTTPPLDQQQIAPPLGVVQEAYTTHKGHGSVGPVIAVVFVIIILGIIAGMIGRICSGRRIMGHGEYDMEGWVERKCSSCLDGRVDSPPTRHADIRVAAPVMEEQRHGEVKEEEEKQKQRDQSKEEVNGRSEC